MGCFGKTQELNEEVGRRTSELLAHLLDACKKKVEDLEEMLKERRQPWWRRIFSREAVESAENRSDRQLLRKEIGNFRKEIRKLRKELEGLEPEQLEEMRNIQGKVTDLEKRQHEVYEDIDRTSKGRPLKRQRIYFIRKQRPVKDGKITNDELEELAGKLGSSWDALGRRLGFTNAEITGFHKDNEEYANKPLKMLFKWREKEGSDATYRVLFNALCHRLVQRADLAEQFCCK